MRRLPADQAKLGYPVRFRGFVTYYDPDWPILYIQDESSGIGVELEKQDYSLKPGQKVEVTGVSAPGNVLPIVAKAQVRRLRATGFPPARTVSLSKLDIKREDSQWMQTEGIVHNAYQEGKYSILELYEGKNEVVIRIRELLQRSSDSLIDARVRIQGVLAAITDSASRPIGLELRVPGEGNLSIMEASRLPAGQIPISSIAALGNRWKSDPPQRRIRIQGTVMPGNTMGSLLVQDQTGVIEAKALFARPIAPGDEVDLIGFADLSSATPRIINATYLRIKALAIQSREEKGLPTLTGIKQIRSLTGQEAARGYPVRVEGVITYHNPQLSMTFLQNGSDAIYLQSLNPMLSLEEGKKYEVEGFSAPGDFAPIIVKPRFRLLGNAPMPGARDLTLDELSTGQFDCLRVRLQGIVRSVRPVGSRWCLELFSEGKGIEVWIPNQASSSRINSLQDAKITAEGICSIQISDRGNITGFRLNVPSVREIRLVEPARADPFSTPLRSIRDVFRYSNRQEAGHRVRIQGMLLYQEPGSALYLKDETGCISVAVDHILPVNSSDLLTVSGYIVPGDFAPIMTYALVKRLGPGPPPVPRTLTDTHALNNNYHGDLVRIRAKLVDQWSSWDGQRYLMQTLGRPGTTFEALLANSASQADPPKLRNGSELELTGIYQLRSKLGQSYRFLLILRTPEDIRVLKSAPWWTLKHTYWTVAILLFLVLSALAWIAMLRKQVRQQTDTLRLRMEAEAALEKKHEEQRRQGQKLEAIGNLAGGIAHDFNNILSAILGYAELSAEDLPPDHPVKDNLSQILKAGKRARDLVQQILAFSRKLDQERRPLYLQTIVDEALKLLKATLPSTIEIQTRINPKCGPIMADPTQMHQVILNLATNAFHAMQEKGGVLKIDLDPVELNGTRAGHVQELPPGRYTCLCISDNGPGIGPEIQKRIFEPYFTTKSAGQGSGLGLAVVHGIIQSHGGAITVDSALGRGAAFQAYIPCCDKKPSITIESTHEIAKGHGNILLVDDEEAIVNLGVRSLGKMGYCVTGETHSMRALEMFVENPGRFDLVVTDQTMPNLTGISLAQELWKVRPGMPIIISSGYSEQITSEKAASLGFLTFLTKPYTVSELAKAIRKSLP